MMTQSAIGYKKLYCVVYTVCGTFYRYRCFANNAREAKRECHIFAQVPYRNIVEAYKED